MTGKDKQLIAKIELMKIKGLTAKANKLLEANDTMRHSLYGATMDYSKDRVQSSPVNKTEETLTKVVDNDKDIDQIKKTIEDYLKEFKRMENKEHGHVLALIYVYNKSYMEIARIKGYRHRSNVEYIHKKALENYYNTIYGVGG